VTADFTGDPFYKDPLEYLPEWAKSQLQKYLKLLKREGLKKSSVAMQKTSNLKFCQYLQSVNVNQFLYHLIMNLFTSSDNEKVYQFTCFDYEFLYH
jgi:hypothetical protein